MLTQTHNPPVLLTASLHNVKQTFIVWARRYETRQQLKSVPSYLLEDIGLTSKQKTVESKRFFWH